MKAHEPLTELELAVRHAPRPSKERAHAREHVEAMPVAEATSWDPGPDAVHRGGKKAGVFVTDAGGVEAIVEVTPPPADGEVLGSIGVFVSLALREDAPPGTLCLPYSPKHLDGIDRDTLRLFWWNEAEETFRIVEPSGIGKGNYVYGRVAAPGRYAILGMPVDKEVRQRIAGLHHELMTLYSEKGEQPQEQRPGGYRYIPIIDLIAPAKPHRALLPTWRSLGPTTIAGMVSYLQLDPGDPRRLYALATDGGLWVLDNIDAYPETTWRPLTDKLPTTSMQRALAVTPGTQPRIYIIDENRELRISDDRGVTWHAKGPVPADVYHVDVHRTQPNVLYVATTQGLYQITLTGSGAAATTQTVELIKGQTNYVIVEPGDARVLYAGVRNVGVVRRDATTATPTTTTLLASSSAKVPGGRVLVALGPGTAATRSMAARIGDEVFRRSEPSASFVSKGEQGVHPGGATSEWCSVLAISPAKAKVLLAGSATLARSEDGGDTWTSSVAYNSSAHADQQDVVFDAANPGRVWLANDGGVYRSDDDGKTWTGYNQGLVTAQLWNAAYSQKITIAGQYHWGIVGDPGSGEWASLSGGAHEFAVTVADPRHTGRFYVARDYIIDVRYYGAGRDEFHYELGKLDVATLPGSTQLVSPYAIGVNPFLSTRILLVGCDTPGCVRRAATSDDDANPQWSKDEGIDIADDSVRAICYVRLKPWIAFALTAKGLVFRNSNITDDKEKWTKVGTIAGAGSNARALVSSPTHAGKLWALCDHGVYGSTAAGTTWVPASGTGTATLPSSGLHSLCVHPSGGEVYAGGDAGVFMTTNDGATWFRISGLPRNDVRQLSFVNGELRAVTHGRGIWRLRTPIKQ